MGNVVFNQLSEIVTAIIVSVNPKKIFLFGSFAMGSATPDSDLDLLIITGNAITSFKIRRKIISVIRSVLSRFRIPKDILVYDETELNKWSKSPNHIIVRALAEGKLL